MRRQPGESNKTEEELSLLGREVNDALGACKNSPPLLILAAYVSIGLRQFEDAAAYGKMAVDANPADWQANSVCGNALYLMGEREEGISYLEKAASYAPDNLSVLFNLCSFYEESKKYRKAVDACTSVVESRKEELQGPARYIRGRAYRALKVKKKADEDLAVSKALGFDGDRYYKATHPGK